MTRWLPLAALFIITALAVLLAVALSRKVDLSSRGEVADGPDYYDTDGPVDGCRCIDCEDEHGDPAQAYVESVLDEVCDDMASYFAATRLGADQATCEMWRNRVWSGLRHRLDDEQRLTAIVLLLTEDAQQAADELTIPEGAEQ